MQKTTLLSFIFILVFSVFGAEFSIAQVCNSEMTVVKNRDSRSATLNDATIFQIEIQNNSSKAQIYTFNSNISDQKCGTPATGLRSTSKADLNVSVKGNNLRSNSLSVAPGATVPIQVEVSVGPNIKFNSWYCIEFSAVSDLCSSKQISKNLKLYVSDGSDN